MKNSTKLVLSCCAVIGPLVAVQLATAASDKEAYKYPSNPALPESSMEITKENTALVITDPQVDFLSPDGVAWGAVGESVTEHGVVGNLGKLFEVASESDMLTFISPHYYFPHDHKWQFEGKLEKLMHGISMFDRAGELDLTDFDGSGADYMPEYKKYIDSENTVVTSPHKVYGPEQNDLVLQLRKRGIDKVILAGMSANLCVQAHMHELIEQGFEVMVVQDATAGAIVPEGDGYLAALINFRFMASEVLDTDDVVTRIKSGT